MKRPILITCSFLIFFSGVTAAWENCTRISFTPEADHHSSPVPAHTHDHHGNADHQHSGGTIVHCPPVDDFLLATTFSISVAQRVERITATVIGQLDPLISQHGSYPLIHGPPGFAQARNIPRYLSLSVLRI